MSFEITTAFVKQYEANLFTLAQQRGSRLRNAVDVETGITGDSDFFDQIDATTAQKRTSRHADTPLISTPHARRKVTPVDYDWADLIDNLDKVKMLIDPASKYAINGANAMGRAQDDEIIAASIGTAYTGADGTTATVLPSTQKIANGSTNMTLAKLISIKEILDGNEVDEEEPRFVCMGTKQFSSLLGTTEIKSIDYNSVKALVQGQIDTFMGFKFIRSERLAVASSVRSCFAWSQMGILLGIWADQKGEISIRDDKNYAVQVYASQSVGATRMDEKRVVQVDCLET